MNKAKTITVTVPIKFRKGLPEKIIIARGLDKGLILFGQTEWKKKKQDLSDMAKGSELSSQSKQFVKLLIKGAYPAKMDKSGHITIPDFLAEYAEIKKDVVVVPAGNKSSAILIWAKEVFKNMQKDCKERNLRGIRFETYFKLT